MSFGSTESGSKLVTAEPAASLPVGPDVAAAASMPAGRPPPAAAGAFTLVVLAGPAVAVSFLVVEPAAFKPAGSPPPAVGVLPADESADICLRWPSRPGRTNFLQEQGSTAEH